MKQLFEVDKLCKPGQTCGVNFGYSSIDAVGMCVGNSVGSLWATLSVTHLQNQRKRLLPCQSQECGEGRWLAHTKSEWP
jgi:hypothetical protein